MDFVHDGLADGRRIRCLNIVDDYTKETLAIEVDTSLSGSRVARVLDRTPCIDHCLVDCVSTTAPSLRAWRWMLGRINVV